MRLYSFFVASVCSVAENIKYRNYEQGDINAGAQVYCSTDPQIPCYVAVDLDKGDHILVGYILMYMPYDLPDIYDKAVRSMMKDPSQKGDFGYIAVVEVDEDYRGREIGTNLVKHCIAFGESSTDVLAMTLDIDDEHFDLTDWYKKFGFQIVLENHDERFFALYYSRG
ncbi:hypothetical protein FOL47_003639 [Perkinsus chesapeaki]|uniref:N-acetyltransferase domain-containing protein n=1 Tax=Perkinsus chesapeaki TaxID=330153 RepID=A0A7J6M7D0_PERCH|nr:hypothetical protein FOL47_003639 [Perkinsus chesapeaki]